MRKLIISAVVAVLATATFAASPAATQAWTSNLVNNIVRNLRITHTNTPSAKIWRGGNIELVIEKPTVYMLMATNATNLAVAQGVTNGMYFAWNADSHSYTNHADAIVATQSNFVWRGIGSTKLSFPGYFDVIGRIAQPSVAENLVK